MDWNHRVVRVLDHIDEQGTAHYTLTFAEVYYNDDGTPMGHAECFMHGDDLGELRQLVNRLGSAINQEILDERDMRHVEAAVIPDSDEDIFEVDNARMSVPNDDVAPFVDDLESALRMDQLSSDECPLCGNAETCKECK